MKPWSRANDEERLDPFNGLLLAPHLDVAFDQGLITFGASGELVISPMLSVEDAQRLNLDVRQRLSQIEKRHEYYLAWHREWIFQSFKSIQ
ncbi:HNH endonuclease [Pseudomonas sp. NFACC05-1]|uniref:HNH endonuclease n=1 Tax=Pseudomonas sp. NFACC05-1 TaxID=1566241 RepID=UPI00353268B8